MANHSTHVSPPGYLWLSIANRGYPLVSRAIHSYPWLDPWRQLWPMMVWGAKLRLSRLPATLRCWWSCFLPGLGRRIERRRDITQRSTSLHHCITACSLPLHPNFLTGHTSSSPARTPHSGSLSRHPCWTPLIYIYVSLETYTPAHSHSCSAIFELTSPHHCNALWTHQYFAQFSELWVGGRVSHFQTWKKKYTRWPNSLRTFGDHNIASLSTKLLH